MKDRSDSRPKSARKARGLGYERRLEILAAAERIFVANGYEGATIRKIADEVGVSPTALYMHFPDKHAMLMEIGVNALGRLAEKAATMAAGKGDPADRLREIMAAHMKFALANKTAYRIVFSEAARQIAEPHASARQAGEDYYRTIAGVVGELEDAGRVRTGSRHAVAQVLYTGCHGLVSSLIVNPGFGFVDPAELMRVMLDGLIGGLFSPQPLGEGPPA